MTYEQPPLAKMSASQPRKVPVAHFQDLIEQNIDSLA